ncbi:MAG TPA: S8 family peptidase [Chloroflexota bacterium]|nr:S8 family peptidase [Chloroflexota bacterium]
MRRLPLFSLLALTLAAVFAPSASAFSLPTSTWTPGVDQTVPIQPLLQVGAQVSPLTRVRVIIQKSNPLADSRVIAMAAHAAVVEEFGVIPAFTADLTLQSVLALATNPNVRYVSLDAITNKHSAIDASNLQTIYPLDIAAPAVWNPTSGTGATGRGVTVAVIDTGLDLQHADFHGNASAINVNAIAAGKTVRPDYQGDSVGYGKNINPNSAGTQDGYGHGTHVAGIIAAENPNGQYIGVAPNASVIGVKVADDGGMAFESDLLRGLDWVYLNQAARHIRVVNLSVGTGRPGSYATSPIDAAVERLWHNGVTVVVAAGNAGNAPDAVSYAPGNDPYVITVGCLDDNLTASTTADDSLCPISSRGLTQDGFAKPDVIAPGRKVTSTLASGNPVLAQEYPERITPDGRHLRMSGTSMATPVVSGTVALLLERFPNLTPDQIKNILTSSAGSYPGEPDHAGAVNALAAFTRAPSASSAPNMGVAALPGLNLATGFGSVLFDGSRWVSSTWDGSRWVSSTWDGSRWVASSWDGSGWVSSSWDGSRWVSSAWDGSRWVGSSWDGSRWVASSWDGSRWVSSSWDASHWVGSSWDGSRWVASSWDGSRWVVSTWDGSRWVSSSWDGSRWVGSSWDGSRWVSSAWNSSTWDAAALDD